MPSKAIIAYEPFWTKLTLKSFLPTMSPSVFIERAWLWKCLATDDAFKWLLACMWTDVLIELTEIRKRFFAVWALKGVINSCWLHGEAIVGCVIFGRTGVLFKVFYVEIRIVENFRTKCTLEKIHVHFAIGSQWRHFSQELFLFYRVGEAIANHFKYAFKFYLYNVVITDFMKSPKRKWPSRLEIRFPPHTHQMTKHQNEISFQSTKTKSTYFLYHKSHNLLGS